MEELVDQTVVQEACRRYGVKALYLFGSVARGDQGPDSDYDFLVEFLDPTTPGIADRYFDLKDYLADRLGAQVDLVSIDAVRNPVLKRVVDRDKVQVYG